MITKIPPPIGKWPLSWVRDEHGQVLSRHFRTDASPTVTTFSASGHTTAVIFIAICYDQ